MRYGLGVNPIRVNDSSVLARDLWSSDDCDNATTRWTRYVLMPSKKDVSEGEEKLIVNRRRNRIMEFYYQQSGKET